MLSCFFLVTFGARAAAAADEGGGSGWRSDLPWDDLKAKLSSSATLIDTGYEDFAAQCIPEFVDFVPPQRSTYALINQVRSCGLSYACSTVYWYCRRHLCQLTTLISILLTQHDDNIRILVSVCPICHVHMRNVALVRV